MNLSRYYHEAASSNLYSQKILDNSTESNTVLCDAVSHANY